jgi:EAL domain-containing protein (putative c-di-GMP-specific phosphodiesterase class I)
VDTSIVQAITAMAHNLKMRVVAEGVETAAQLQILRVLGCDVVQGFLFAPPMTATDCQTFLTAAASENASTFFWPRASLARTPVGAQVVNL